MDQILKNMEDPSWWFTGIFFILMGILLTKLTFSWLPIAWNKISKLIPVISRKITRWKEREVLLTIKRYRQHEVKINWLIGRYWCLATVSILYMGFLAISFMVSKSIDNEHKTILSLLPAVFPFYLLMLRTMWEKNVLKRTIKAHIQWNKRITSA